jgi:outer membrane receptor protein involved in Fe transport
MNVSFIKANSSSFFKIKLLTKVIAISLGLSASTGLIQAAENDLQYYDIAPNTMSEALKVFAMETNSEILFSPSLVANKTMSGLKGEYTRQEALTTMLAGANLVAEKSDDKVFMVVSTESERNISRANIAAGDAGMGAAEKKAYRNSGIEEITVTANKREQDLQDVAMSLSALTGDDLNRIGAVGAQDYLAQIPGVNYNALGRGRSPIIIRGVSTGSTTFGDQQSTTAIYIDDLPSLSRWGAWTNTDPSTFDIERVEVLRGPQGTLFGSGALGGALRVITNKPNASEFQSSVDIGQSFTQGGDDGNSINAMLNVPLVDDELALRVVAFKRNDGGYVDNTRHNEKNINGGETEGGRVMLAYTPNDDLALRFTATHQADVVDNGSAVFREAADGGPYQYSGPLRAASDVSISIFNLSADYSLGSMLLTSSTTYSERDSRITRDVGEITDTFFDTGLDIDDVSHSVTDDVKSFAQEIRLSSQGEGQLLWTVGAFFLEQDIDTVESWTATILDESVVAGVYLPHITEKAVFGEVTYEISDQLSITAGGRWFDNTFEFQNPVFEGLLLGGSFPTPLQEETSSSFTPKVSASYHVTDDVHLYATASEGFRVGQVNFGATPSNGIPPTFGPDSLWNYEAGVKSILLDGQLKLNVAAFYIDWTDIQLRRTTVLPNDIAVVSVDNAGDAVSKGLEVEVTYIPSDRLELGTSFTYNEAKLESVLEGVALTPGSTLPGTPEFSMANYLQYIVEDLPEDMSGYIRLSHNYVGEMVSDIDNSPELYSDSYNTFDVRAGLFVGNYEVSLYVENLANSDAVTSRYGKDLDSWVTFRAYRLKPRTFGLNFRIDF